LIQPDIFREDEDNTQIIGFMQFKIQMGLSNELPTRDQVVKPKLKKFQLRAHIYQGRELPAADDNGVSDPFCVVRVGKYSLKTKIIKKTVYPLWYETLQIPCELPENLVNAPDINVSYVLYRIISLYSVYDWDQVGDNDYMGRFSLPLNQVTEQMPEKPKWYPIYLKTPTITEGEILASFQL
jgi:Ca2+-dependent lipid-binding protein